MHGKSRTRAKRRSMSFDALGRLFEASVLPRERRRLGQHFTSDEVADILVAFTIRDERDVVLDPSCGAGAFLARAYDYKKRLAPNLSQRQILQTLYGVEIADIPARLACERAGTLLHGDFLSDGVRAALPRVDALIGNPPYTRQEDIDGKNGRLGRAGLHSYFVSVSLALLNEGGRLGFVMPEAWLQTEYGAQLQRAILQQCKVVAIISSKVERWFPDANVNTCLLILERCSERLQRQGHVTRIVHLKVPLNEIARTAPQLRDEWLARQTAHETNDFALRLVVQPELFRAPALHAPPIYHRALEIAKTKQFPPLREVAGLRFGVKTGANDFFYLESDAIDGHGLEPEFFAPIVFSLKEIRGYVVDAQSLRWRVLLCQGDRKKLQGTQLVRYIERGERDGLHLRPTCANRKPWYALARGWATAPLLFPSKIGERMPIVFNEAGVLEDKKFYGITPHNPEDGALIGALLNSTISRLFVEFGSRQLTGSQAIADVDVVVAQRIPLPNPQSIPPALRRRILAALAKLKRTPCESLFIEYGGRAPQSVDLTTIKPQLRRLDALVMGGLWGLSDAEQVAIYRALVDHVACRLRKARSLTPSRAAPSKTRATA